MKRYLFIGLGLALILAGVAVWLMPVRYEVFALLRLAEQAPGVLKHEQPGNDHDSYNVFKRTQVQLILSPFVMRRVCAEPVIAKLPTIQAHKEDPASWLKSQLILEYPDDSEILRIAMNGEKSADMVKIVDMTVKMYLKEIVQNERDKRIRHEAELNKAYEDYQKELAKQMDALHQMEMVAKTSSTEAAQVNKRLATAKLDELLTRRARLRIQLDENAMQSKLLEAREEEGNKTADPAEPAGGGSIVNLSAHVLAKQKELLEKALDQIEAEIQLQAETIQNMETFSANVASKQERLRTIKSTTNELAGELERSRLNRLSMDRITKVDDAELDSVRGDATRKNLIAGVLALVGLVLIVAGAAMAKPRSSAGHSIHDE
jgi:hypothetical protein